jgi:hypothetical protein
MSSTKPHEGPAPDSPSDVRALSPRPNLEYERKQAKQLLDQLKRGDPEAIARLAKHKRDSSGGFQLSDAQFTIAREYGFTSWPRLVEYFETLERHEVSGGRRRSSLASLESWARTIQADIKDRRVWTVQYLSAYVPRFHGRTVDQVLASEVTIEDARLATARMYRYPSWEAMVADLPPLKPDDAWETYDSPALKASRAFRDEKLEGVERLAASNPEVLDPGSLLAHDVILREIKEPSAATRRAYDWLAARMDLQPALNQMVLGHMRMQPDHMQRLLDLGADPHWSPPNGYTVLEHVIVRAWNGGVVDLIAERVQPRPGFWISAGLGDANAVTRYFDNDGDLTDEARNNRPDFSAISAMPMPSNPDTSDEMIIWEAFLLASLNERLAVLDVLLDRGFPVDYIGWGQPMTHFAVSEGRAQLLEYLIRRGANLDLKGWRPHISARELAEQQFLNPHALPTAARILELSGGRDPETLRRERAERRAQRVMATAPQVEKAFDYAKQGRCRQGTGCNRPGEPIHRATARSWDACRHPRRRWRRPRAHPLDARRPAGRSDSRRAGRDDRESRSLSDPSGCESDGGTAKARYPGSAARVSCTDATRVATGARDHRGGRRFEREAASEDRTHVEGLVILRSKHKVKTF